MKTNEIIKWIMPNFPVEENFSGECSSYKMKVAELQLICSYFIKFFEEDISLEFPVMDYYHDYEESYYDTGVLLTTIGNYEASIKESLYDKLLAWSSFEQVRIGFPNVSCIPEAYCHDTKTWDMDRRQAFIKKHVVCLMDDVQRRLYEIMPAPVLDCLDMQSEGKVVYLFSEKLAEYLRFAKQQKSSVKESFFQEHWKLIKMLPYLKAPIEKDVVHTYMSMKQAYMVGYCVGWKDYKTIISYRSYKWTFFMAWYVTEKILRRAEEML